MTFKWGRAYALAGAAVVLSTFAVPANAISFTGTFNIASDAANDPALVIVTNPGLGLNNPLSLNLTLVSPTVVIPSLFQIGTTECCWNGDDFANKNISVTFSFTAPPPAFGGPVTGETNASLVFIPPFFVLPGGRVDWDAPIQLAFGNGGLLGIELFDTDFLLAHDGQPHYSDVKAKFTLLLEPTQQEAPPGTPIPGAVWLFGTVLAGGAGFGRWRKKRKAQLAAAA